MKEKQTSIGNDGLEGQIVTYLNKHYRFDGDFFFNRKLIYAHKIVNELQIIYNITYEESISIIREWTKVKLSDKKWHKLMHPNNVLLKIVELIPNRILVRYRVNNSERFNVVHLLHSLVEEFGSPFFEWLLTRQISMEVVENCVLCEGYMMRGNIEYDMDFKQCRNLFRISEKQTINERKNNIYWQDWLRATERNPEA